MGGLAGAEGFSGGTELILDLHGFGVGLERGLPDHDRHIPGGAQSALLGLKHLIALVKR